MADFIILLYMSYLLMISFQFFIALSSTTALPRFSPVYDVDGEELKTGEGYYILSSAASVLQVGICRQGENVIQCPFFNGDPPGLPIVFTPVNSYAGEKMADTIVRENTYYNIFFVSLDLFTEETFWYLKDGRFTNQLFVAEGPQFLAMQFAIKKIERGYKIVYCVSIPIPRMPICYPLGFNNDNGYNRLGIGPGARAAIFSFMKNATCPIGDDTCS